MLEVELTDTLLLVDVCEGYMFIDFQATDACWSWTSSFSVVGPGCWVIVTNR
jgi:hypothetical protein